MKFNFQSQVQDISCNAMKKFNSKWKRIIQQTIIQLRISTWFLELNWVWAWEMLFNFILFGIFRKWIRPPPFLERKFFIRKWRSKTTKLMYPKAESENYREKNHLMGINLSSFLTGFHDCVFELKMSSELGHNWMKYYWCEQQLNVFEKLFDEC